VTRFSVEVPVRIRPCSADDVPALEWDALFTHQRQIFAEAYARQQRGEGVLLVADVAGRPAGQAWVDLVRKEPEGIGVISSVRVVPLLRGAGIGRRLVQAAERILAGRGFGVAEIGVERGSGETQRLYERLGYRVAGRVRETYFYAPPGGTREEVGVDEWLMHKPLESVAAERWEGAEPRP
jgi:ribosomal protein S18 acetylase RimI-like enzyme